MQVEPSQTKEVTQLFRFRISSKFGSECKLNCLNQRRSPYLLLVPPHDHLWYNRPYLGISHIWACLITAVTLAQTFVINSRPRHFLPAIGQHAIYIESRSPDPLNKSHLGISHIWACLITAVTLAKTFERL